ncbi:MAG: adenylate/guanylate cyclase domain-containing protein [Nitrospirales bacterium]
MRPRTYYAKSGETNIAYQVTGDGPVDLIRVPGWVSNIDYDWEYPPQARLIERLSRFSRYIRFDKRGTGLSDREVGYPTLEQRMEDVRAVMEAVGSQRAVLFGSSEGGSMCILFAATYPERTTGLILHGSQARGEWALDYPWAPTKEETAKTLAEIERDWGGTMDLTDGAPSLANDRMAQEWSAAYLRYSASPKAAIAMWKLGAEVDVRDILPSIRVPTLVLHKEHDRWIKQEEGHYLASQIPNAKFILLPGLDHVTWGDGQERLVEEVEEFVTGVRPQQSPERALLTVLFSDIVGSTQLTAEMGDSQWQDLLQKHHDIARNEFRRHGGTEVKSTGDGFLATFLGPTPAIKCAKVMRERLASLNLPLRVGIHIGECNVRAGDISGLAVHLASRLLAHAGQGDIVVSRTVKDLLVGSEFVFDDRGTVALRDIPGDWQIYAVG